MSDLISRQDAITEIKALYEWHDTVTEDRAVDHLKRLPSAEPKTGEWEFDTVIPIGGGAYSAGYRCSNCGANYFNVEGMSFCPNCGARMNKGGEDE